MSQETLDNCRHVKNGIVSQSLSENQMVYPVVRKCIRDSKQFYGYWFDVYHEYGSQFLELSSLGKIKSPRANVAAGLVSRWVTSGQRRFKNSIIHASIPAESYLLVEHCYNLFGELHSFILQEDDEFRSRLLKDDFREEFADMDPPRVAGMEPILSDIDRSDIYRISYDSPTFDSAQAWLLLLHEASHDVYTRESLQAVNPQSAVNKFTEIFLDILVEYIYGPAYALALASYHRKHPGGRGETHPVEPARLYALVNFTADLKEAAGSDSTPLKEHIQRAYDKLSKYYTKVREDSRYEQREVDDVYNGIKTSITAYLEKRGIPIFTKFVKKYDAKTGKYEPDFKTLVGMAEDEIPMAVDPRIMYNTIIEHGDNTSLLIRESLKRWKVRSNWPQKTETIPSAN